MNKLLFIVRHAHREKPADRKIDNGLSEKGQAQAQSLLEQLKPQLSAHSLSFVSSPSKRCIETLKPMSEEFSQGIESITMLLEQQEGENAIDFQGRLAEFSALWDATNAEILIACSHGDVIPELTQILIGEKTDLSKGKYLKIEQTESGPAVCEVRS